MKLIKLYIRVLRALHRQAGLAWTLALANIALAAASFAAWAGPIDCAKRVFTRPGTGGLAKIQIGIPVTNGACPTPPFCLLAQQACSDGLAFLT